MDKFIVKKKPIKECEQITFRIERNLLKQIRQIVEENDLGSLNNFINDCIIFAMENMDKEEN